MANPTSNFNWQMPTPTDLVTDLPADFEVFGQAVDSSMADLLGGTTGQILAKNSNTNMDFVWITNDVGDITAVTAGTGISGGGTSGAVTITNSMATEIAAKGDLIVGTGSATFDNLTAGSNGETLVADSSTSTGLRYTQNFAAGKNKIINGDCAINQRAFSSSIDSGSYLVDRFIGGNSGGTVTYSVQQFTAGTAPVAGYEAKQFMRLVVSGQSAAGDFATVAQEIEDVRTFAGQTITVSFWAKANSGTPSVSVDIVQKFGSGGSPSSNVETAGGKNAITTSWARYSYTFAMPSLSGKTIGTTNNTSSLRLRIWVSAGSTYNTQTTSLGTQANTFDVWGVQVEAGSVATAFQTATGTIQGELAAAMRYFQKTYSQPTAPATAVNEGSIVGINVGTTLVGGLGRFAVVMRTAPTITLYSVATGTSGKIRSGGADINGTASDVGDGVIGYIAATGLTAGSNSIIQYTASAEL